MKLLRIALAATALASGQTFDVAAIKPPNPQSRLLRTSISGGALTADNVSLRTLIEDAYQLLPLQLTGGPGWLVSEMWSISAKGDPSATPEQVRAMLRNLLADRFHLKLRVEKREQSTYALLVRDPAKAAARILRSPTQGQRQSLATTGGEKKVSSAFRSYTMASFASALSRQVERMVFDETGLAGQFDFALEADREIEEKNPFVAQWAPVVGDLGLRLESRKGLIDFYVVESAQRPSEN